MSRPSSRPTNAERHQRRAARPRQAAHPYPRPSSSLADALGGEGPPPLYTQPAGRVQAAASTTTATTTATATTTTTKNAAAQYDFGAPFATYGASSSSRAPQNGESSRLARSSRQYEEARYSTVGHYPAKETGDAFVPPRDHALPSAPQPSSSSNNNQPAATSYNYHPAEASYYNNQPAGSTYQPPSSTAAYRVFSTAATQPFPLPTHQSADAPPPWHAPTEPSLDSTAPWFLECTLESYFHNAALESLQPNDYAIGADLHNDLDAHSLLGLAASPSVFTQDALPSAITGDALADSESLGAAPAPTFTFDLSNPPSPEEQLQETAFWGGALYAPLLTASDAGGCYRVPVPPGTDDFAEPIVVKGKLGLHCRKCRSIRKSIANKYIFRNVHRAKMNVDYAFAKENIYVHRGLWGSGCDADPVFVFNSTSRKKPATGFKLGHLVTMMAAKQYKAWFRSTFKEPDGTKDLQDLVGVELAPQRGTPVRWENVYLVAVRRIITDEDSKVWHYFPEIEIRL